MPQVLGWWVYVIGLPLFGGALLTVLSVGGKGKHKAARHSHGHAAHSGHGAQAGHSAHASHGSHALKAGAPKPVPAKAAPGRAANRQAKAAELPPLFLAQNFLLIWSLVALAVSPLHPQNAAPVTLAAVLAGMVIVSMALLAACASIFARITPTDATSITTKSDLEGRVGECDATIDEKRGSILVRDEFGTLHHAAARSREPIARGQSVLVIQYEPNGDYFQVQNWTE